MATMTLTLIGMYNYNPQLFEDLTLPDEIDKDVFINSLLLRSGEFELLYPQYQFMHDMIGVWSKKWKPTFDKWVEGQKASWNPIENYDRYENTEDHTINSSEAHDTTTAGGSGTNEHTVSAYDSSNYSPAGLDSTSSNSSSTSNTNGSGTNDYTHESHIHGNIGVTQASDMLASFYKIAEWNLMDHIADVFIREFCIPVY